MTDQELLQAAAKAAGMRYIKPTPDYSGNLGLALCDEHGRMQEDWSPLTDDGDALRLAVKLELHIRIWDSESECGPFTNVPHGNDPYAATRRAIVRAAAESGAGSEG